MRTISRAVTYEEWLSMPLVQDGVDEIVDGEYRLMPPAKYAHVSPEAETIEIRQLREVSLQPIAIAADGNLQPIRFPSVSIPISTALWPRTP